MVGKVLYKCKENDNHIYVDIEGGGIDELWFGTETDDGWVVIGYDDLMKAIEKAKKKLENKE